MTFDEMLELEPRLKALQVAIRRVRDEGGTYFCANERWYGYGRTPPVLSFKTRMCKLVGWGAAVPALRSDEAYAVAYEALYGELPDCRQCLCI